MCFENLQSSVVSLETKIEEPNSRCYVMERLQLAIFNNTSPFPEPKFMDLLYQKSSTFLTACGIRSYYTIFRNAQTWCVVMTTYYRMGIDKLIVIECILALF
jgi:hypothetical protein